jgi:hypothetical protein
MVMNQLTQLPRGCPQLGPVLALQALLTEYPELPPLTWRVETGGTLAGYGDGHDGTDVRAALAAYVDLFDATPTEPRSYPCGGETLVSQHLDTVWQDVRVHITTYANIAAYPELLAPTAVAA